MLLDSSQWKIKQKADSGDQQAQIDMLRNMRHQYNNTSAMNYCLSIINSECKIEACSYLYAHTLLATMYLDGEEYVKALAVYQKAKLFMEEHVPTHQWDVDVYEHIIQLSKMFSLLEKADSGDQQALYDMGIGWQQGDFLYDSDRKAVDFFSQVIAEPCQIKFDNYIYAHQFVAWCKEANNLYAEAVNIYNKAKDFMESQLPPDKWQLDIYDNIINAELYIT